MEVLYARCAGLDVHKKKVVACVLVTPERGAPTKTVRTFGTLADDVLALGDWLAEQGVTHVALESTSVYWQPLWNLLEDRFALLLVNAQHVHQVPGRKTDVRDCEWLADLLRHGLLRASFVPDRPQRELRELVRYRTSLVRERGWAINRLQKTLEGANLKLGSVASNVVGRASWAILSALVAGETDSAVLCPGNNESGGKQLAGRTRKGNPWLRSALVEAAHAAVRSKGSYLGVQFRRIASRRGAKRALIAVAHTLLTIIYYLLTRGCAYADLGPTFFDQQDRRRTERRLVSRLEQLGYRVSLQPLALTG